MKNIPECYGIIPARYASTRFPAKPLADILGKPMFWHVFKRAAQCPELLKTVLATDDTRIYSAAEELDVPVVMTRPDHPSGTDRVMEAADILDLPGDAVVVNIQGDEPAMKPKMLTELVEPFVDSEILVTTMAKKIRAEDAENPDQVKVVFGENNRALYFSRSIIPYARDDEKPELYGHIGLYAFRMKTLKRFVSMPAGRLENTEKLEQLRLLENNIPIHIVVTDYQSIGVDRPEDIKKVIKAVSL
ncbi:3-deoxy-manno-octulosonate cytidylyltransferase (CMP-KDO synthetase) [Desulfosarcina sp. BuS5]|uniref:3-deoxy-manno-octulosonate cytidylyltransferase n=1 Tax=Desulfosarcina sp. BuS5 TaxID=933262 RepID=UPI000480197B|nr:3-deoxy-manno-octulosonate cytidylyltransferase [Desulfosarcina sp. BuS5]WDN90356.1 3-deoxy-manno-octulosonate cytidylyltransferase (CMP-KDO synthetase) [Desulfosarcina sp. BuS5]